MTEKFFTNSLFSVAAVPGAVRLLYKTPGVAAVAVDLADGAFILSVTSPGPYNWQQYDADGNVLSSGEFTAVQDLAHASASFDPRSEAEITLAALDAKIAGRALTIQQSKVTVGDRSIEYINSIAELLRWRDYYARVVAREHGLPGDPTAEVCT